MTRIKKFLKSIWIDITPEYPKEFFYIICVASLVAVILMIPILGLAWFLAFITNQTFEDGAVQASLSVWGLIIGVIILFNYLKQKWQETQ